MYNLDKVSEFNGLEIYWGHGQIKREIRAELVGFWLAHGAIVDPFEAWRRSFDVGCIVLNADGNIVGVSSIYVDRLAVNGPSYWFYRTFVSPDCRVLGISSRVLNATFDKLSELYSYERGAPSGVVLITENPKLEMRAGVRTLNRNGFEHIGTDQQRRSIWLRNFPLQVPNVKIKI